MKSGRAVGLFCCVAVLLAGCGIGAPWPHSDGTAWRATSGHRDILLFGDSLMGQMSPALPGVLAAHNMDATVRSAHADGSGLVGTIKGQDPLAYVTAQLDARPETDIVVFQWSGMCARPCPIAYGSEAFFAAWFTKAQQIVQQARARDLTVLWTIAPPPPPDVSAPPGSPYDFNEAAAMTLSWRSRGMIFADSLAYADSWKALAGVDDFLGHWDFQLFYDGAIRNVRANDFVQLTPDGATRAATWTASSLADHWNDNSPHAPAPGGAAADAVLVSTGNGPKAIDFPDPFVFRPSGDDSLWYGYATGAGFVDLQMISSTRSRELDAPRRSVAGRRPTPGPTSSPSRGRHR